MKKPTKNCVVFKCTKLIRIWPEQKTNQVCRKKVFPRTLKRAPLATKVKITFQISKTPISFIGINGIGCRYVYNHNPNSRTCVQKIIKHIQYPLFTNPHSHCGISVNFTFDLLKFCPRKTKHTSLGSGITKKNQ